MAGSQNKKQIIDTDIHERATYKDLLPYLDNPWKRYITDSDWVQEKHLPYPILGADGLDRADAKPPSGGPAGNSLSFMQEQLLDDIGHEAGILTGALDPSPSSMHGWYEMAVALATAYNDWQIENWLDKDERIYGSVHVAAQDPQAAVREIERVGPHPKMVQVLLPIDDRPWGDPYYHPIFEAAERHDLTIGMHHNEPPSYYGQFPRYFVEWHSVMPNTHMVQINSMVFNGVFEKYPNLKLVMIEAGFTYAPALMKKMDQQYKALRHEVPWVKRLPSRIIQEHVRFTTQPVDELSQKEFMQFIELMGSEDMVCFSTDYPHWDYDSPFQALPALGDDLERKIFRENARAAYPKLPQAAGMVNQ
ncbi:amidohydrolase family protein [Lentibacillus halophilus]|uniref:Amidohydrolase family protein n=1 Tax=Lentibacillus halophilus TaxID=295065 RepID=A0ABP3J0A9_9BACI